MGRVASVCARFWPAANSVASWRVPCRVGSCKDGSPRVERCGDACLGDAHCLLLHNLQGEEQGGERGGGGEANEE